MKKILIISMLGLSFVSAQSLQELEVQAAQNTELQEKLASVNQRCGGATITADIDWQQFSSEDLKAYSAAGYCGEVLSGIAKTCESSDIAMKAVQEKLKSVTCGHSLPRAAQFDNGSLRFNIDFSASNDADFINDFLMKNL